MTKLQAAHDSRSRSARRRFRSLRLEALEARELLSGFDYAGLHLEGTNLKAAGGDIVSASGDVKIGLTSIGSESFRPLLDVTGVFKYTPTNTSKPTFTDKGTISAIVGTATVPLETSTENFVVDVLQLLSTKAGDGVDITTGGLDFNVPGGDLQPTKFRLDLNDSTNKSTAASRIDAFGSLTLSQNVGTGTTLQKLITLSFNLADPNFIAIDPVAGISPGKVSLPLTVPFNAFALPFTPTNLQLSYAPATKEFDISGSASVSMGSPDPSGSSQTIVVDLGTPQSPGFVYSTTAKAVTSITMGITVDTNLFGLTIHPTKDSQNNTVPITFAYKKGTDAANPSKTFSIYGGITVDIPGNTGGGSLTANLGTSDKPGLTIDSGKVTSINIGIAADPNPNTPAGNFFGLPVSIPQPLTLVYDTKFPAPTPANPNATAAQYELSGGVQLNLGSSVGTIAAGLGSADKPGLTIRAGKLQNLTFNVTSNITLAGLPVAPSPTTPVVFTYDATFVDPATKAVAPRYELTGGVKFSFTAGTQTSTIDASLVDNSGSTPGPGLIYSGGKVQLLALSIISDINLFGVTVATLKQTDASGNPVLDPTTKQPIPIPLAFKLDTATSPVQFELTGGVQVGVSSQMISATFGSTGSPGLIVKSGQLQKLDLSVSGSFDLGAGLTLAVDTAGITFVRGGTIAGQPNNTYALFGSVKLAAVFNAGATLGSHDAPGVFISNGKFQVQNLEFMAGNVNLGAVTLTQLDVKYANDATKTSFSVTTQLTVFQQLTVGGILKFVDKKLDTIGVLVSNLNVGLGNSGLFLQDVGGTISGLQSDKLKDFRIDGFIAFTVGPQITLGSQSGSLVRISGSLGLTTTSIEVGANVYAVAYTTGKTVMQGGFSVPEYAGALASATGKMSYNWSTKTFTVTAHVSVLNDLATLDAGLYFDAASQVFGIRATAALNVPQVVPVIGGQQIASANFALLYNYGANATNKGFIAGWSTVFVGVGAVGKNFSGGFKYSFDANKPFLRNLSVIRGDAVKKVDTDTKFLLTGIPPVAPGAAMLGSVAVNLIGTAAISSGTATLSAAKANQAGAVVGANPLKYDTGFDTTFQFSIPSTSEGLAFVIQAADPAAQGSAAAGLGFGGGYPGLAIKFDTHQDTSTGDPAGNFIVALASKTKLSGKMTDSIAVLKGSDLTVNISDNKSHTARVTFTPNTSSGAGLMAIYLDNAVKPSLSFSVNLADVLGGNGTTANFELTGSTGTDTTPAVVTSWAYTASVPPPEDNTYVFLGFSDTTGLSLVTPAAKVEETLALTPKTASLASAVWTSSAFDLSGGAQTDFQFQTTPNGSGGFALVFQSDPAGAAAVGGSGNALGAGGIKKSVVVAFSSIAMAGTGTAAQTDLGTNSIAVYSSLSGDAVALDKAHRSTATITNIPYTLNDGKAHTVVVQYDAAAKMLKIFTGNGDTKAAGNAAVGIDLAAILGGTKAYVGITAGTGTAGQTTSLIDFALNALVPAGGNSNSLRAAFAPTIAASVTPPLTFLSTAPSSSAADFSSSASGDTSLALIAPVAVSPPTLSEPESMTATTPAVSRSIRAALTPTTAHPSGPSGRLHHTVNTPKRIRPIHAAHDHSAGLTPHARNGHGYGA